MYVWLKNGAPRIGDWSTSVSSRKVTSEEGMVILKPFERVMLRSAELSALRDVYVEDGRTSWDSCGSTQAVKGNLPICWPEELMLEISTSHGHCLASLNAPNGYVSVERLPMTRSVE